MAIGTILGIASAGTGILSGLGANNARAAQEAARVNETNKLRAAQYKQALKAYAYTQEVANTRYSLKKSQYRDQLFNFDKAAGKGYRDAQRRLNQQIRAGRVQDETRQIGMSAQRGMDRARNVSGRSASRLNAINLASFGRDQAMQAQNLMTARQDYQQNVGDIRDQLNAARRSAYSQVMFAPRPAPLPEGPVNANFTNPNSTLGTLGMIGSSLLSGIDTASTLTAPGQGINSWLGIS